MENPNQFPSHSDPQNDVVFHELPEHEDEHEEEEDEIEEEVEDEEDEELQQLEGSVVEISQQIADYRNTLPNQLKTTLASLVDSQIPILPLSHQNILGSSRGSTSKASVTEEDAEDIKKLELLKQKLSRNASTVSVTLKRMRECMDKMDKLQSLNGVIHPAFKKKRLTD